MIRLPVPDTLDCDRVLLPQSIPAPPAVHVNDTGDIIVPATVIIGNISADITVTITAQSNIRDCFTLKNPLVFSCDIDLTLLLKGDQICLITSQNKYRIDYTNNPSKYLAALKMGSPYPLKIIGCRLGNKNIESQYHLLFKDKEYIKGWFDLNDEDVKLILKSFIKARFSKEKVPMGGQFINSSHDSLVTTKDGYILNSNDEKTTRDALVIDNLVITCSGKIIKLWDLITLKAERLIGHTDTVNCLAAYNNYIASASDDYTIRLWNLTTKTCDMVFIGHELYVTRVIFSSEGKIISASHDKTIRVWNLDGTCEAILKGHENNLCCITAYNDCILSGAYDNTLKIWKNNECMVSLNGHTDAISCMVVLPDNTIISGSYDQTLRIWNQEGKCSKILMGHKSVITCITYFVKEGNYIIITGSYDGNIRKWNLSDDGTPICIDSNEEDRLTCLIIQNEKLYASTYVGTIKIWDINTFKYESTLKGHHNPILKLNFLSDGRLVSTSTGSTTRIYNM